jgi:hypothetical protein
MAARSSRPLINIDAPSWRAFPNHSGPDRLIYVKAVAKLRNKLANGAGI